MKNTYTCNRLNDYKVDAVLSISRKDRFQDCDRLNIILAATAAVLNLCI